MRKNATKLAAAVLSLAMVMTSVNMPASAAKTKVKLNKTKATLYVNGTKSTTLKTTFGGKNVKATFKSSKKSVATVSKAGKVTAKKNGTTTITATYKNQKATCKITVKTYATSVSVTSAKTLNLTAGKTATIKTAVKPATASNKNVSFKSNKTSVATVSKAGKVTAKKAGSATVTVTALGSKNAAKKATVKVNVKAAVTPTETPTEAPTATPETPVATEGAITVTTNVTGASVTVTSGSSVVATGAAVGTSFTTGKIANGTYTVKVSAPGYKDATKEVVVNDDVAINVELEKASFEAAQVGRQTIKVTGDDLTDKVADYVVKRGKINVAIDNVKLADDKKSAVLTSASSALTAADDYTVSFKNGAEYKLAVVAEKTTKIDVKGNDLVLDSTADKGTIYFNVYNQFGERMQADIVTTCTIGTVAGTTSSSKTADTKLEVTLGSDNLKVVGTKGILVLVDKNSGVTSGQVEVKVNSASKIAKIDVVGLYKKGVKPEEVKEIKKSATAGDYALAFKAYDQYGKELSDTDLTSWNSDVTVSPAGVTGLTLGTTVSTISVGDNTYLALDLDGTITAAGTQMFTIVSNSIGLLGTTSIKVVEDVSVAKVKIAAIDTLYNGTKAEVSYTAVDTEGKEVTDYNTLNGLTTSIFGDKASQFNWERANDGKAKLYFTPSVTDITGSSTASQPVSVITTVGTSVEVTTFTVYNAKKVNAIVGFTADTETAALDDAKGSVNIYAKNFKVQDQYGNLLTTDEFIGLTSGYKLKAAVDGTNNGFADTYNTQTDLTVTDADTTPVLTLDSVGATTGKVTKIKFTLFDAADNEIKGSDSTVSLRTVSIEDVTDFAVEKPATQFVENSDAGKIETAVDNIEIKVTGKASGANVVIPAAEYKVITAGRIAAGTTSGTIKVAADTAGVYAADGKSKGTVDETFEIVIANKAGTSVKQTIALSSIDKKVTTVKLKDKTEFKLTKANSATVAITDITGLLDIKDQYDGDITATSTRVKFTNIPDGISVTGNNTSDAELTLTNAAAKTYTITVEYTADGVVYTDTLVLTVTA